MWSTAEYETYASNTTVKTVLIGRSDSSQEALKKKPRQNRTEKIETAVN